MKTLSVVAMCAALVFAACGDDKPSPTTVDGTAADGGDFTSDGGLGADADAAADSGGSSAKCGSAMSGGGAGGEGCSAFQTYSCGSDDYRIDCSCPAAKCTCTKNGVVVGSASYDSCPACEIAFASAAKQCGIPSGGEIIAPPPSGG